jgi:cell wall-associated NlpC family hydrolase
VKSKAMLKRFFFILLVGLCTSAGWSQTQPSVQQVPAIDSIGKASAFAGTDTINQAVEEIIQFAKKFLGTPYHYAGSSPSGFDCSGFIYYVMGNFGLTLSRSSPGMAEFGKTVKLSEIRPGDLMFFKGRNVNSSSVGHVAMVIEVKEGVIKFIHSSTSRGVVIDTFNSSKYYIPRFINAKRLDYGGITGQ